MFVNLVEEVNKILKRISKCIFNLEAELEAGLE